MIYILLIGIVSNAGTTSINKINDQFAKLQCPTPLYNLVDFGNGTIINSDVVKNTGKNYGSYYQCFYDTTSNPPSVHTTINFINYNATSFTAFPDGWFKYVGDWVGSVMFKIGAVVNLLSYILTPINFNILGITLANLTGFALMFVIFSYLVAYLGVGLMAYKSVSPFVGG